MSSHLSELKFLLKHSSIYGLGSALSKMVGFMLLPLYTRVLTPKDYGILELIDVTMGMIGIVVGFGVVGAMSRFYYEPQEEIDRKRVVSTVYLGVFCITGLSVFTASFFAGPIAGIVLDSSEYREYFIVSFASLMFGILIDVGLMYLQLLHKSVLFMSVSIASLIVAVFFNILFIVYMKWGVLGILYGSLATKLIVVIPMTAIVLHKVGLGFRWTLAKEMLKYSIPLIPSSLATTLVNYSDRYFIKQYVSIADAGIYGLANKLGAVSHMLITSPFITAFLPRRFQIVCQADAKEIFSKVYDCYFMLMLSIGLILSVFIDDVMRIMTSPDFYRAGPYVPLIVLTTFIFGMKYHFEFGILYSKNTKYYSYINVSTACAHLTLNFLLVPSYGLWGAVLASFFAICLNTALIYLVGNQFFSINFGFMRNAKMFAVALVLFALCQVPMSANNVAMVGYKLLLVATFPVVLVWMRVLPYGEIVKIKQLTVNIFRGNLN